MAYAFHGVLVSKECIITEHSKGEPQNYYTECIHRLKEVQPKKEHLMNH